MTNNKQQTAVDVSELAFELYPFGISERNAFINGYNKAKEMEKVRMESTWIAALDYAIELLKGLNNLESKDAFDQFYNETFGGGNK
jgi:hypothetical protein